MISDTVISAAPAVAPMMASGVPLRWSARASRAMRMTSSADWNSSSPRATRFTIGSMMRSKSMWTGQSTR